MLEATNKLIVFQKAHELALQIYKDTKGFPKEEMYGLTSQIRRAAVSVPSNIAEGKARGSRKENERFLLIARGSLEELKYQVLLARDLGYLEKEKYQKLSELAEDVSKMLNGLIKSLRKPVSQSDSLTVSPLKEGQETYE